MVARRWSRRPTNLRADQPRGFANSSTSTIDVIVNVRDEANIERVRIVALLALSENARLTSELVRTKRENLLLKGATPEQLQQELALLDEKLAKDAARLEKQADKEAAKASAAPKEKKRKSRKRSGSRLEQKSLRVVEVIHDVDKADQACRECGGALSHWEGQDDETEEVDVITREFVVKKHVRRKYRCACGCLESADMPARLVPGGRYSNEFAIEVATMKYVDQLPLERIVKVLGREGLVIDSQTLWDQVNALASKLAPAHARLRQVILSEKVIGMDQSPWKVLGHAKSWQMWTLTTKILCYFDICQSKGEVDGRRVLGDFAGTIIADAATTHESLSSPTVRFAHCWAHVIRRARELSTSDPLRSAHVVRLIQQLYDLDSEAGDDDDKRLALRKAKSSKIVDDLYLWRREQRPLASSPTAQLLGYLDNHEVGLKRFLKDPRIPLDNNQSERGYCWVAVGRRSFFGSRSKRGTEVAALFYSLAETARRVGVDPRAYFTTALAEALAGKTVPLPHELLAAK